MTSKETVKHDFELKKKLYHYDDLELKKFWREALEYRKIDIITSDVISKYILYIDVRKYSNLFLRLANKRKKFIIIKSSNYNLLKKIKQLYKAWDFKTYLQVNPKYDEKEKKGELEECYFKQFKK